MIIDSSFNDGLIPSPSDFVKAIDIASNDLPPIHIDYPFRPSATPPKPNPFLQYEQPKITLSFEPLLGQNLNPVSYAPYGNPGPNNWDFVEGALAVGAVSVVSLLAYGLYKLILD